MEGYSEELIRIRGILRASPHGMSVTEIARTLGRNKHSVGRYMDILLVSGHVEMRMYGKAKVFTTSSRIPLDSLLGGSQDLILVVDRDNRVVRINDQFLAILGRARSDILGKNISFLPVSDPSFEPVFAAIRSSLKSGHFDTELRVHAGNEQIFRQKIIPTVFDDGGQGMIVLLENITDRKAA